MRRHYYDISHKFAEADFFLDRMKEAEGRVDDFGFYFSAYTAAARSVTFVLQATASRYRGWDSWYEKIQSELKANQIANRMHSIRNVIQKEGLNVAPRGTYQRDDEQGVNRRLRFFDDPLVPTQESPLGIDVVSACESHMKTILEILDRFFRHFEREIRENHDEEKSLRKGMAELATELTAQGFPVELFDPDRAVAQSREFLDRRPGDELNRLRTKYEL